MLQIIVPGDPIAKMRPRFVRRGNFVGTYNPQETEEGKWLWQARQQIPGILAGPLALSFHFHMPIPKSVSQKKRQSLINSPHVKKPDVDNCLKFCLDCLNGVLFEDDRQVYHLVALKTYSTEPRTVIVVLE